MYDSKLAKFIDENAHEISNERSRLMLLGKARKLQKMGIGQRNRYLASFLKKGP